MDHFNFKMNLNQIVRHQKEKSKINGNEETDSSICTIETNEKEAQQSNDVRVQNF